MSSDLSDKLEQTEKVLQGIPLLNIGMTYSLANRTTISKTYLIPLKNHHHQIHGLFVNPKQQLDSVPIGFVQEDQHLQNNQYYQPKFNGEISPCLQSSNITYLPLKVTSFQMPSNNAPILGIHGLRGLQPVVYIIETNQDIIYCGLFQNNFGKVQEYLTQGNPQTDQYVKEALRDMTKGKIFGIGKEKEEQPIKPKSKIEVMAGNVNWKDPQEIIKHLNKFVIGQDNAKEVMAGVFSNYLIKAQSKDPQIRKTNVMMYGPTGVGKTLIAETLAKSAGLHFERIKVGGKTPEGYIGDNLSSGLINLREKMPDEEAPFAVVLLDEIDKIASGSKPELEERMQNQILGWAGSEGDTINFRRSSISEKPLKSLETRNILFVATGAFSKSAEGNSLEQIMKEERGEKKQIGYKIPINKPHLSKILRAQPSDIIKYGFKEEFLGRFPIITSLDFLTVDQKAKILMEAEDSIWISYQKIFKARELNVQIDNEIPMIIAENCPKETGARALDTTCSQLFTPILIHAKEFINKGIIHVTSELAQEILSGEYKPQPLEEEILIASH